MGKFNIESMIESITKTPRPELLSANNFPIMQLPLSAIEPNPENQGFSMDDIDSLAASISDVGLQQPLVVRPNRDKYLLVSGERRYHALVQLSEGGEERFSVVPCVILDLDRIDLPLDTKAKELYALATTNAEIRNNTPADNLKLYEMLSSVYDALKNNGYRGLGRRREYIAEKLGASNGYTAELEKIGNGLAPKVRAEFDADRIPIKAAVEIAQLSKADQKVLLESVGDVPYLTMQDVKDYIARKDSAQKEQGDISDTDEDTAVAPDVDTIKADLSSTAALFRQSNLRPRQLERVNKSWATIAKHRGIIQSILDKGKR